MMSEKRREWRKRLRQHQDEIWYPHDSLEMSELLHFSPLSAFKNVVVGKEMWLTHVSDLGLPGELHHANAVFRKQLNASWVAPILKNACKYQDTLFGVGTLWHAYIACFCSHARGAAYVEGLRSSRERMCHCVRPCKMFPGMRWRETVQSRTLVSFDCGQRACTSENTSPGARHSTRSQHPVSRISRVLDGCGFQPDLRRGSI